MEYKSHVSDYTYYSRKMNKFNQRKIIPESKAFCNHFLA